MGVELVLSLHLPSWNGAATFSVCKEHRLDPLKRRRCVVSAEDWNSGFSSNIPEGNLHCRFHSSLDNQHPHHRNHQQSQHLHHHQHQLHHPWQGSLDGGQHAGRLGSGLFIAAESGSGDLEKLDRGLCTNSFLHNGKCPSPIKGDQIAESHACAGGFVVAGVDLPLSLRMLKRKQQDFRKFPLASGVSETGNSLLNAFSSVIYMMKVLQRHTLHLRQQLFDQEIEGPLSQVQREMHVSFLWLFQQVLSCTPELMMLVLVLLVDFTAFSMANNVPVLPISEYTTPVSVTSILSNSIKSSDEGRNAVFDMSFKAPPSVVDKADGIHNDGGSAGNGGRRIYHITEDDGGDSDLYSNSMHLNKAPYSVDGNLPSELSSKAVSPVTSSSHEHSASQVGHGSNGFSSFTVNSIPSAFCDMATVLDLKEVSPSEDLSESITLLPAISNTAVEHAKAVGTMDITGLSSRLVLAQETMQHLVAPFSARLEDDDYSCYDRTDLAYQVAIQSDPMNPMLLANYAQFLFLVRKDHDRAEELFRRAVQCDPFDCDAIGRFASFLWLARHNLVSAEKAYQAVLRMEPANSFQAANYAHFLWNSCLRSDA